MAANKTFQFFFGPLLKKFFQDMGRDPNNLEMILLRQKAGQLLKDSNKIINFPQKRSFVEEIKAMKKSGDLVDKDNIIISDKITNREMFKNSNLNKDTSLMGQINERMGNINKASKRLDEIMKEREEMYKPKTDAEIAAKYDKENKESIQRFKDKMKKDEPEDKATGGRAGYYTGGITDVEPRLDDIGHGSDSLMSRTRLMSPGSQATTSTGLNYLLAEDNDNIRVPFKVGGDAGRRAFLKLMATLGGGIAGIKSGILGLGGGTGKKAVTEAVKQSAGSGQPPPYFFRLVEKIKTMGDDTLPSQDKVIAKKYKDYTMEEDFAGNIEIIKKGADDMYPEDVYMSYKVDEVPTKIGKKKSTKVEEYEEFTATPDAEGKMKNIEQGVPDEVVQEGTMFEDNMTEFGKADGGRIGFRVGGSGKKFIEKIFGKGSLDVMKARDPEMHKGMLEVVEMFRNRDKSGLVEYMQNFLPHMSKKEIQAFIKGDAVDIAGQGKYGIDNIQGQLIRLGSGRDYAGKIKMIKDAENMRALDKLDVDKMKPNANGGLQTMLGE